jgi:hypothetical protein
MKKNNAIAIIGYIAVILAPIMGLTGVIMAIVLICKGARFRQAVGVLITGLISWLLSLVFYTPGDLIYTIFMPALLTCTVAAIFHVFTMEEK